MAKKLDYVVAKTFGRRKNVRFQIPNISRFEQYSPVMTGRTVYHTFTGFVGGQWSLSDVESILSWAHPSGNRMFNQDVAAVLEDRPGRWAPMAAMILEAALFGLEPDKNVFEVEP